MIHIVKLIQRRFPDSNTSMYLWFVLPQRGYQLCATQPHNRKVGQ